MIQLFLFKLCIPVEPLSVSITSVSMVGKLYATLFRRVECLEPAVCLYAALDHDQLEHLFFVEN